MNFSSFHDSHSNLAMCCRYVLKVAFIVGVFQISFPIWFSFMYFSFSEIQCLAVTNQPHNE